MHSTCTPPTPFKVNPELEIWLSKLLASIPKKKDSDVSLVLETSARPEATIKLITSVIKNKMISTAVKEPLDKVIEIYVSMFETCPEKKVSGEPNYDAIMDAAEKLRNNNKDTEENLDDATIQMRKLLAEANQFHLQLDKLTIRIDENYPVVDECLDRLKECDKFEKKLQDYENIYSDRIWVKAMRAYSYFFQSQFYKVMAVKCFFVSNNSSIKLSNQITIDVISFAIEYASESCKFLGELSTRLLQNNIIEISHVPLLTFRTTEDLAWAYIQMNDIITSSYLKLKKITIDETILNSATRHVETAKESKTLICDEKIFDEIKIKTYQENKKIRSELTPCLYKFDMKAAKDKSLKFSRIDAKHPVNLLTVHACIAKAYNVIGIKDISAHDMVKLRHYYRDFIREIKLVNKNELKEYLQDFDSIFIHIVILINKVDCNTVPKIGLSKKSCQKNAYLSKRDLCYLLADLTISCIALGKDDFIHKSSIIHSFYDEHSVRWDGSMHGFFDVVLKEISVIETILKTQLGWKDENGLTLNRTQELNEANALADKMFDELMQECAEIERKSQEELKQLIELSIDEEIIPAEATHKQDNSVEEITESKPDSNLDKLYEEASKILRTKVHATDRIKALLNAIKIYIQIKDQAINISNHWYVAASLLEIAMCFRVIAVRSFNNGDINSTLTWYGKALQAAKESLNYFTNHLSSSTPPQNNYDDIESLSNGIHIEVEFISKAIAKLEKHLHITAEKIKSFVKSAKKSRLKAIERIGMDGWYSYKPLECISKKSKQLSQHIQFLNNNEKHREALNGLIISDKFIPVALAFRFLHPENNAYPLNHHIAAESTTPTLMLNDSNTENKESHPMSFMDKLKHLQQNKMDYACLPSAQNNTSPTGNYKLKFFSLTAPALKCATLEIKPQLHH